MYVDWSMWRSGWAMRLNLTSKISALTRWDRCSRFKIGITGDPDRRAYQYGNLYDDLVVVYKTRSEKFVRDWEWYLTCCYWGDCDNSIKGGGGKLEGPPYYLYVVRRC